MADPANDTVRDSRAAAVTPLTNVSVRYNLRQGGGIQTGTGADWFGPQDPLKPLAPPEVTGRTWDFPVGFNVVTRPRAYEAVGFAELRALAQSYDLLALIIETRKDQLSRLPWTIAPRDENLREGKKDVPAAIQSRIDAITKFFKRPDHIHRWSNWLRMLMDDMLVIDAPTLFCERTRGGQLLGLRPIDGATIKRVIDDWGMTPAYPLPAYQQVLKGLPALNYTERDMLYRPRNRRVHKAYGFSPVEQIVMTVNIALRRQLFTLQYFTEGNVPESLIGAPDSWTPEQIAAFQVNWDTMLEGNTAARRHAKFVPAGVGKTFIQTKDASLSGPFDEWLARITCYAFSVSPEPFITKVNRATAENAHDAALEEGLEPNKEFVKGWIDDIIESPQGFGSDDIEFRWQDDREVDPEKQKDIVTAYTEDGIFTVNQAREKLGEDPSDDPAADVLMVKTATGFVPIGANTIDGKLEAQDKLGPPQLPGAKPGETAAPGAAGKPGVQERDVPPGKDPAASKVFDFREMTEAGQSGRPFVLAKKARRVATLSYARPAMRKAVTKLTTSITKVLRRLGADVSGQVRKKLKRLGKAAGDEDYAADRARQAAEIANTIALSLDLSGLETMVDVTEEVLAQIGEDSGRGLIAQLGVSDPGDLVDQVNERVAAWARARSAEMVGMRYNADGELVEAVRAEYRIDEATRDMIRVNLADSLAGNLAIGDIIDNLQTATAFSEDRAELIARTEITRANNQSSLIAATTARDTLDLGMKKLWLTAGDDLVDEEICQPNEDDGALVLEDDFSSGDDAPPGHPRCRCTLVYDVEE